MPNHVCDFDPTRTHHHLASNPRRLVRADSHLVADLPAFYRAERQFGSTSERKRAAFQLKSAA
jgi:hypothetical protein